MIKFWKYLHNKFWKYLHRTVVQSLQQWMTTQQILLHVNRLSAVNLHSAVVLSNIHFQKSTLFCFVPNCSYGVLWLLTLLFVSEVVCVATLSSCFIMQFLCWYSRIHVFWDVIMCHWMFGFQCPEGTNLQHCTNHPQNNTKTCHHLPEEANPQQQQCGYKHLDVRWCADVLCLCHTNKSVDCPRIS
jgi:hypothetical protein